MAELVYQFIIQCYVLAIRFYALFNAKAKKWIVGRNDWQIKLAKNTKDWQNCIWFHCASLGEFEQGRPLIEKIKEQHPNKKILVTFFSPSGYELRKNYIYADYVCYLPIDNVKNAQEFIHISKCSTAIFIKYEWWYFYFKMLNKNNIPLYVVSTVFNPKQIFFKWYGGLHRKLLSYCSHIFCQDKKSENLLQLELNIKHCSVAGDTRYDTVYQAIEKQTELPFIANFKNDKKVIIGGSTYEKEDEILKSLINNKRFEDFKFIIVPHDINHNYCKNLKLSFNGSAILHSEIDQQKNNIASFKVLIVDNVGLLLKLYSYANYALVGGGFDKGIHNILEAAVYGIQVFSGPNHNKAIEAIELKKLNCFYEINSAQKLEDLIFEIENDEIKSNTIKSTLTEFFEKKIGATEKIYSVLKL